MAPLQSWTCDSCGEAITDPNGALVVWRRDEDGKYFGFRIVHKNIADGDGEPRQCDPEARAGYVSNLELSNFLGADGLAMLLSWLSWGPLKAYPDTNQVANFDEYVDLVRRVQTPWYEEARQHFGDEDTLHWLGDANEYYPYLPDVLERTAKGALGRQSAR